jgi:formylglycine-generating enzyme required for sulfatase activity
MRRARCVAKNKRQKMSYEFFLTNEFGRIIETRWFWFYHNMQWLAFAAVILGIYFAIDLRRLEKSRFISLCYLAICWVCAFFWAAYPRLKIATAKEVHLSDFIVSSIVIFIPFVLFLLYEVMVKRRFLEQTIVSTYGLLLKDGSGKTLRAYRLFRGRSEFSIGRRLESDIYLGCLGRLVSRNIGSVIRRKDKYVLVIKTDRCVLFSRTEKTKDAATGAPREEIVKRVLSKDTEVELREGDTLHLSENNVLVFGFLEGEAVLRQAEPKLEFRFFRRAGMVSALALAFCALAVIRLAVPDMQDVLLKEANAAADTLKALQLVNYSHRIHPVGIVSNTYEAVCASVTARALAYEKQRRIDDAIGFINKALQIDPDCKPFREMNARLEEEHPYNFNMKLGNASLAENRYLNAVGYYNNALNARPGDRTALERKSMAKAGGMLLIVESIKKGDFELAGEYIDQLKKLGYANEADSLARRCEFRKNRNEGEKLFEQGGPKGDNEAFQYLVSALKASTVTLALAEQSEPHLRFKLLNKCILIIKDNIEEGNLRAAENQIARLGQLGFGDVTPALSARCEFYRNKKEGEKMLDKGDTGPVAFSRLVAAIKIARQNMAALEMTEQDLKDGIIEVCLQAITKNISANELGIAKEQIVQLEKLGFGEEATAVSRELENAKKKADEEKKSAADKLNDGTGARAAASSAEPAGVFVPAGDYVISVTENGKQVKKLVNIPKGFYVGRFEVTVGEFSRYCSSCGLEMPQQPDAFKDDYPVVNVTWSSAAGYARWLGCRLPTAEEWMVAASSGGLKYAWGNKKMPLLVTPLPVGSLKYDKSPFGCYDMTGNVSEWTSGDIDGKKSVCGSSYQDVEQETDASLYNLRAYHCEDYDSYEYIGFRCVKDAE